MQNLAINAATTADALFTAPENTTDASNRQLIGRVLQPGMTQVSSMVAQNLKLVSVELGGNEVLNARSGIVIPGATVVPFTTWAPLYDEVLEEVGSVAKEALIVGLIDDVGSFPRVPSRRRDVAAAFPLRRAAHVRGEAERRGFAYFALQELYGRADIKGPFNPIALMTSPQPYGPFISLDGVHPTAAGAQVLALAAARALDERYNHDILGQAAPLIASQ